MKDVKLYSEIKQLIDAARNIVIKNINTTLIFANYNIGRIIVEYEQYGNKRAKYAEETLKKLSIKLTKDFGKGYTQRNLELMRKFYLIYSKTKSPISFSFNSINDRKKSLQEKQSALNANNSISKSPISKFEELFKLSWTHYLILLKIENDDERRFYEIETVSNNWSVRELERQYNSSLYERIAVSKNKSAVKRLSKKGQIIAKPIDILKEPLVLEFLDLKENSSYTENRLETAIINKLENFLLEMGKGFLFQSRQHRISFNLLG